MTDETLLDRLRADPRYADLVGRRSRFGYWLAAAVFVAFVGFTLLIAFDPALLARPIGEGVTTLGVPLGLGLILFAIALTGLYVERCNRVYDREIAEILAGPAS